ncbi:FAD dependent oxidoreductase [Beauveria brongniartii RCEF 3172]|uniref:FAD dependent oxidoreductase n=1 Tax=Beauveria brongniartii RCEF 3172 TaxID=1081107 RepID=A0A167HKX0_9HYPO|nr:FAD dependent oxidoreductase [Beauveria brongniartii RCEF 3172]
MREFDLVILATGYDAITGSLYDMHIRDRRGTLLQDKWRDGVRTHMGMMVPGVPNAFLLYGPQAPGPLTNGPTFIELQVELLCRLLGRARGHRGGGGAVARKAARGVRGSAGERGRLVVGWGQYTRQDVRAADVVLGCARMAGRVRGESEDVG